MSSFSERLRESMKGMPILALSSKTGIPESTIRSYLTDRATPKMDKASKLSSALGVDVLWLLHGPIEREFILDDPADLEREVKKAEHEDAEKAAVVKETLVAYMDGVADYIEQSAWIMERGGKVDLDRLDSEVRAFEDLASKIEIERGVSLLNYIHAELEFDRAWPDAPEDKKNQVLDILKKQIRETGKAPGAEIVEAICFLAK